jgi:hypothetical protein
MSAESEKHARAAHAFQLLIAAMAQSRRASNATLEPIMAYLATAAPLHVFWLPPLCNAIQGPFHATGAAHSRERPDTVQDPRQRVLPAEAPRRPRTFQPIRYALAARQWPQVAAISAAPQGPTHVQERNQSRQFMVVTEPACAVLPAPPHAMPVPHAQLLILSVQPVSACSALQTPNAPRLLQTRATATT